MKEKQIIPTNSKKVFSGLIFDVYQWQQKMFDGNYKTFEAIRRTSTCGIIPILENKKIIISKETQPGSKEFFGFPGGRLNPGELPVDAAKRELLEETGLKASSLEFFEKFQLFSKIDFPSFTFIGHDCKFIASPTLDSGEKISLIEVSFDELLDYVIKDNFRDIEIKILLIRTKFQKSGLELLKKRFGLL